MLSEDEEIARSVAENGWHAISVTDSPPAFVYTCGLLTTFRHPELIIFGLEPETAYSILAAMVEDLRNGRSFAQSGTYDGVLDGGLIAVREVHPTQHEMYLGYAMGHCRHMRHADRLTALQVFWPDKEGRFPFEVGCQLEVYRLQTRVDLEVPPSELRAFRRRFDV